MIISHVKLSLFKQSLFIAYGYSILLEKTVVYVINRIIHVCLEIPDLFLVLNMISHDITFNTRNKSGISAHPCIILYLIQVNSKEPKANPQVLKT